MVDRAQIEWEAAGVLRSRRFQDVYFSREDGLAEARAVFLAGCGLPDAWRGRDRFVVGELGFGTGLNILALLQLWSRQRPPGARLRVFSIEAFPLNVEDAARALQAWPELQDLAAPLLNRWPNRPGFHRIEFPGLGAVLDIAIAEAAVALDAWDGRADAWFLDGFSPSKNPGMWRDEVLALVARRSAPGACAATFSVAGAVRRGLQTEGFTVARRPGFGSKGERLEAWLERPHIPRPGRTRAPTVAIVGAGIAGAALARAFLAEGIVHTVIDRTGPGAGASGNPAALVTPRLDAGGGLAARLHVQAFDRAQALYRSETPDAIITRGALQLEAGERDRGRFDKVAASDLFEDGALVRLSAEESEMQLGEPVSSGGLLIRDGLVVEPAVVLARWLAGAEVRTMQADRLEAHDGAWRIGSADGAPAEAFDIVCIAAGFDSAAMALGLELGPVRGQASIAHGVEPPHPAAWGGYVIPTRDGLLFGATHDRGDADDGVRPEDQVSNLALLARRRPVLTASLKQAALGARAGVRAATPDHAPLAGGIAGASGLFVLGGLGGRGFTLAPLMAEHIVALALGLPSPLPDALARHVAVDRFSRRSGAEAEPEREGSPQPGRRP